MLSHWPLSIISLLYLICALANLKPAISLLEKCHKLCHYSEVQSMYSVTVGSLGYAYLLAKEPTRA